VARQQPQGVVSMLRSSVCSSVLHWRCIGRAVGTLPRCLRFLASNAGPGCGECSRALPTRLPPPLVQAAHAPHSACWCVVCFAPCAACHAPCSSLQGLYIQGVFSAGQTCFRSLPEPGLLPLQCAALQCGAAADVAPRQQPLPLQLPLGGAASLGLTDLWQAW